MKDIPETSENWNNLYQTSDFLHFIYTYIYIMMLQSFITLLLDDCSTNKSQVPRVDNMTNRLDCFETKMNVSAR